MNTTRRQFIGAMTTLTGATLANVPVVNAQFNADKLHIACNQYNWITFYQREGRDWFANLDVSLADFVKTGLTGYEPAVSRVEEITKLAPLLKKYKLEMRSVYVGSILHKADESQKSMDTMLAIADAAKPLGTRIIVSNPNPIKWGSKENKNDDELIIQAQNLDRLGAELKKKGITLAYHNHDPELREAAREFHHMMLGTDPKNVALCLDCHWCYRGAGNSQVALFDIIKLYGKRVVELHLRQSQNGIWTEAFTEGDIDYRRVMKELKAQGIQPHLVLEQSIEKGSPKTMDGIEAHRQGLAYVRELAGR